MIHPSIHPSIHPNPSIRIHPSESIHPNPSIRIHLSESIHPNPSIRIHPSESIHPNPSIRIHPSESIHPNPSIRIHPLLYHTVSNLSCHPQCPEAHLILTPKDMLHHRLVTSQTCSAYGISRNLDLARSKAHAFDLAYAYRPNLTSE